MVKSSVRNARSIVNKLYVRIIKCSVRYESHSHSSRSVSMK